MANEKALKERDIQTLLISELKKQGIECRRVQWQGRDGAPDLLAFVAGGVWIETKAPGKKVRPNQALEHFKMRECGMHVVVIDSVEDVHRFTLEVLK